MSPASSTQFISWLMIVFLLEFEGPSSRARHDFILEQLCPTRFRGWGPARSVQRAGIIGCRGWLTGRTAPPRRLGRDLGATRAHVVPQVGRAGRQGGRGAVFPHFLSGVLVLSGVPRSRKEEK